MHSISIIPLLLHYYIIILSPLLLQICLAVVVCSIKANPAERQTDTGDEAEEMIQRMAAMNARMQEMEDQEKRALDEFLKLETEDEVQEYIAMMQGMRDSPEPDK